MIDRNVNGAWKQIREAISNVLQNTLGTKKLKFKPWFIRICEEIMQRKMLTKQKWLNDTSSDELFTKTQNSSKGNK